MLMHMAELGAILVAAIVGAGVIIALLQSKTAHVNRPESTFDAKDEAGTIFLFCGDDLIDATGDAWTMVNHGTNNLSDLDTMVARLSKAFPDLKDKLADLTAPEFRIASRSDPTVFLEAKRSNDRLRISLNSAESHAGTCATHQLSQDARSAHENLMHDITIHSPQLVWHEDHDGGLLWANNAYASLRRQLDMTVPFDHTKISPTTGARRVAVKQPHDAKDRWFDITTVEHADGLLHFATDTTESVRAESAKKEFIGTLGRTFAELSIGLAIFDKHRLLTLFNPAFLDMTNLPFDFLSNSPAIDTVLDRLRELRMMPEPKDYVSWREQFTALESGAKDGTYSKNWTLADGQTYRVTGRPYPDGAFALLFEDISAEVSLTRRFRLDIETGQAVLDTLSDAIAVFSSTGTLVMSNRAYAALWSHRPEHVLEHRILSSEMKTWQDHCIPSPIWNDMRDFIQQLGARQPWADSALLDDGRHLNCHANPIAGGMTMVRFAISQPKRPEIRKLMLPDPAIQAMKR